MLAIAERRLSAINEKVIMIKPIRRVLVGQNKNKRSMIFEDQPAKDVDPYITGIEGAVSINLWATHESPIDLKNISDPTESGLPFLPPKRGTLFRICDIVPDDTYIHCLDEILLNGEKITTEQKAAKHPLMHQVDVLSYAIVLEGEVILILDDEETLLKAGDTVIDFGSHHAWSNRSNKICRMVFILIDAK